MSDQAGNRMLTCYKYPWCQWQGSSIRIYWVNDAFIYFLHLSYTSVSPLFISSSFHEVLVTQSFLITFSKIFRQLKGSYLPTYQWISNYITIPPSFLEWWSYPSPWVLLLGCQFCFQGLSAILSSDFGHCCSSPTAMSGRQGTQYWHLCLHLKFSRGGELRQGLEKLLEDLLFVLGLRYSLRSWELKKNASVESRALLVWQNLEAVFCLPV